MLQARPQRAICWQAGKIDAELYNRLSHFWRDADQDHTCAQQLRRARRLEQIVRDTSIDYRHAGYIDNQHHRMVPADRF